MHAAVGKQNGGALSRVLIGKIHVLCHTKAEKLFARHCAAKHCLGLTERGVPEKTTSRPPTQAAVLRRLRRTKKIPAPRPGISAICIPTQAVLQKTIFGHFSVQKVFSALAMSRSNFRIPRSSKKSSSCCGEISYTLLNIYYYIISVWKLLRGTAASSKAPLRF